MKGVKVKSFTLPEMLVVMIITVIVAGIAFSVLTLVQQQLRSIETNFQKATTLSLIEQRLWQDFNTHNKIIYSREELLLISDLDSIRYNFHDKYTLRESDTIMAEIFIDKAYYMGEIVFSGFVDAVHLSAQKEVPGYSIFISKANDATNIMNSNGF